MLNNFSKIFLAIVLFLFALSSFAERITISPNVPITDSISIDIANDYDLNLPTDAIVTVSVSVTPGSTGSYTSSMAEIGEFIGVSGLLIPEGNDPRFNDDFNFVHISGRVPWLTVNHTTDESYSLNLRAGKYILNVGGPFTGPPYSLTYILTVGVVPIIDDHADAIGTATLIDPNSSTPGILEVTADNDFFRIDLPSAGALSLQSTGSVLNGLNGTLLDESGNELISNNFFGQDSNFTISQELSAGTYYLVVKRNSFTSPTSNEFEDERRELGLVFPASSYNLISEFTPGSFSNNNPRINLDNEFTGDKRADILIRNSVTGQWRLNPVDGRFVQFDSNFGTVGITTDLTLQNQDISDFTGDGLADALLRNANTGEWMLNKLNGKTVVDNDDVDLPNDLNWQFMTAGDFTGDGISDVILRHTLDGTWRLYPMDGRNVVQDSNFGFIGITPNLDWQPVAASDFNGDNFTDIVLRNQVSGLWLMIPMRGRTVLRNEDFGGIGITQDLAWEVAGAKDFTGDGRADLLLRHNARGQWLMLPMNGKQVERADNFGGVRFLATDLSWQTVQVDDFTGDGVADVLLRNNVTGAWRMHPMNGKTVVRDENFGGVAVTPDLSWELQ